MTGRPFALLLFVTGLACGPLQQDPFETRTYAVVDLTLGRTDPYGGNFSLAQDAIGTTISSGEEWRHNVSLEELVDLIKENAAPGTWGLEGVSAKSVRDGIKVRHRRSAHERIARFLSWLREAFDRSVLIDAAVVDIDPADLHRIRSGEKTRGRAVLSAAQAREIVETGTVVKSGRFIALPDQVTIFEDVKQHSYLRDHDVQIAMGTSTLDPIVDVVDLGVGFKVRAFIGPLGKTLRLVLRADTTELIKMEEVTLRLDRVHAFGTGGFAATGIPNNVPAIESSKVEVGVQLPRLIHASVRTDATMRSGESLLAAALHHEGTTRVFLLTPSTVFSLDEKRATFSDEANRAFRIYDLSMLAYPVQDIRAPRVDLVSPMAGGGPLTGATFTLNDPRSGMDPDRIARRVRAMTAPESWTRDGVAVRATPHDSLHVRQTPEGLKEVERALESIGREDDLTLTTDIVVLDFDKAARRKWAASPFIDEGDFETLLKAAFRKDGVRLSGAAEITGRSGQRIHAFHVRESAYVQDVEPQVSTMIGMYDPIIGVLMGGTVLEVRSVGVPGSDRVRVELSASVTRSTLGMQEKVTTGVTPLHRATISGPRWKATVACRRGKVTVAEIQSTAEGERVLFVRARINPLN